MDAEEPANSKDSPKLAKPGLILIAVTLFVVVRFLVPVSSTSPGTDPELIRTGLALLAFIGFLWLSEALPLAITALFVPVMAVALGILDVPTAFRGFGHPLIFLFLGGFGIAAALSRQELDRWLAQRLIHLAKGHFRTSALALAVAAAGLSMWISNTATTALLLPVALGILAELETRAGTGSTRNAAPLLLLGIAYSASIGGLATLIGTAPNVIAAQYLDIDFASWMKIGLPAVAVLLPIALVILHSLLRVGKLPSLEVANEPFQWTAPRITTLAVFGLTVAAWLASRPLSDLLGVEKNLDSIIAIASLVLLSALGLVGWKDVDRTTNWGVLLLFGGGLTLSESLKPDRTGASTYLAELISGLVGSWPQIAIVAVIVLFVIFLTELSSNTATTLLLVPIFGGVAVEMDLAPEMLVVPLTLAASCAFMLPVATPPNAIVFGSGAIRQRTMMRVGLVLNLALALVLALLSTFLF